MGLDLKKLENEAPHLVDLVKNVTNLMKEEGLDPARYKSSVVATFDVSYSTEQGKNRLYSGHDKQMQGVADLSLAAGFAFDDDGEVPLSLFQSHVIELGHPNAKNELVITPATSLNCLDAYKNHPMGGTNYIAALRWIVEKAGFGDVYLGDVRAWAEALRRDRGFDQLSPLEVKATAEYPTYAIFATDGEPGDNAWELEAYIYLMSQLPIFVSCIGVGANRPFKTLERFSNLPTRPAPNGRLIDNVGAFDSLKAGGNQQKMLELLLGEYPTYYAKARGMGLIK